MARRLGRTLSGTLALLISISDRTAAQAIEVPLDAPDESIILTGGFQDVPYPYRADGRVLPLPSVRRPATDFFRGPKEWAQDVVVLLKGYLLFGLDKEAEGAAAEIAPTFDSSHNPEPLAAEAAMLRAARVFAETGRLKQAKALMRETAGRLDRWAVKSPEDGAHPEFRRLRGLMAFYLSRLERDLGETAAEIAALEQAMDGASERALRPLLAAYLRDRSPKAGEIQQAWLARDPLAATLWAARANFALGGCPEALRQLGYARNLPRRGGSEGIAAYFDWMSALCAWSAGDSRGVASMAGRFVRDPGGGGSLYQQQQAARAARQEMDIAVTAHLRLAPGDQDTASRVLTGIFAVKGALLERWIASNHHFAPEAAGLPVATRLRKELFRSRSLLALRGDSAAGGDALRHAIYATAAVTRIFTENTPTRSYARIDATESFGSPLIASQLPKDSALVEYVAFRPYLPGAAPSFGPREYAAYVLLPSGTVRAVRLGLAAPIEAAVRALVNSAEKRSDGIQETAVALGKLAWTPVEPLTGGALHLFIAPDGPLHMAPLAMLPAASGRPLLDERRVSYLDSGRDLLRIRRQVWRSDPASPPLVIADPSFDEGVPGSGPLARPADDTPFEPLPALPGTAAEAGSIAKLLRIGPDRIWTKSAASEARLKEERSPAILHLATHGEFLARRLEALPSAEEPMLRGFVALAGANRLQSGQEDGVLTGLEASVLRLQGTKMVVLSACRTGVGDANPGEGVYGLRWGFAAAGAHAMVLTLWKVDDEASAAFMTAFYGHLSKRKSKAEALLLAQREIRSNAKWTHPAYWAAFAVSGDPGPIWPPMEPLSRPSR